MKTFNKLFNIGTFVKIEGRDNFNQIKEINESRNLIKVDGLHGSYQRGHVVKFTNKQPPFIYIIKQKMSGTGNIHDIASDQFDRVIEFQKDCEFAVVSASYYGGKGYTTHKTVRATIKACDSDYSQEIINRKGALLVIEDDHLIELGSDLF